MRINGKGRVNREKKIRFTFDGKTYHGYAGDTVASALLANEIKLIGRSFKYHRPRGVLTAGSEEPNALITVGKGAAQEPNIRATQQEIYEGLEVRSQNRWPSLSVDALSLNNLALPFLGTGFYYKTFKYPRKFWDAVYEPTIRAAAGLGALSGENNADTYEKAYAFCDLLIIGAGPTGLMAALTAARSGADVILADEDAQLGGRLLAEVEEIDGQSGSGWAASVVAELAAMDNVRIMPRTTVTGVYDGGMFGALERVSHHQPRARKPLECFWRIHARRSILAAGALERPIAFPNNDRPGVMMAGAVRAYLNRWGVAPGKHVTVFGNNDSAHQTARDMVAAGVRVAAVIDSRHDVHLGDTPFPVFKGAQVIGTGGGHELENIRIQTAAGIEAVQTDCLAISGGWNPTLHLSCHLGARPDWREDIQAFVPQDGAVPGMMAAGACNGTFSTSECLAEGRDTAARMVEALGFKPVDVKIPKADQTPYRLAPLWAVAGRARAWVDFQNDVTVKDIKQAATESFTSVEHMKRYTTQGMAADQGKSSNITALALLADATGHGIPDIGTTTFRPPYTPVSIAAMGAGGQGEGFAPQRFSTSHAQSVRLGAPMIEAGLWYRPSYFPRAGENHWCQSCEREVRSVRENVGVCDVSTLGKIDIQGADAAKLLDFVYTNTFSTLKLGRVRYGLMLREDGVVMDDGTCARMGDQHYVMTTTTAAAEQVMRHLEFVTQCLHPEWRVALTCVTEQWAQFAVAGPKSRALINEVVNTPIDREKWPVMACGEVAVGNVQGRLFRISYSGEHAYELAVPARFGANLFAELVKRAEALGGGAYGMEALNVLRIEKGHITHAEIHGRTTAFDIGMDRMVSPQKDCIGKVMATRPGLIDTCRERLVGLKPAGAVKEMSAGAHLFNEDAQAVRENDQGYVTSVAFSPTLGENIALAFLKNGPARHGEVVRLVDHLRDINTPVEVCDPVFFDPEGGRLRD